MSEQHIGSSFDDFLAEEVMLEEVTAVAVKRVIAWQIAKEIKAQHLTKTEFAGRVVLCLALIEVSQLELSQTRRFGRYVARKRSDKGLEARHQR